MLSSMLCVALRPCRSGRVAGSTTRTLHHGSFLRQLKSVLMRATIDRVYKMHEVTKMSNEIVAGHRSQHASASEVGTKRKRVKTLRREMILERNPKWRVLRQILDEIHGSAFSKEDVKKSACAAAVQAAPSVVIFCRDQRTMEQLSSVLEHGGAPICKNGTKSFLQNLGEGRRRCSRRNQSEEKMLTHGRQRLPPTPSPSFAVLATPWPPWAS